MERLSFGRRFCILRGLNQEVPLNLEQVHEKVNTGQWKITSPAAAFPL